MLYTFVEVYICHNVKMLTPLIERRFKDAILNGTCPIALQKFKILENEYLVHVH